MNKKHISKDENSLSGLNQLFWAQKLVPNTHLFFISQIIVFEFIVSYGVNKNRAMTLHSSSSNVKVSKLLVMYLEQFSFLTDVTLTSKVVLVADMRRALQL